MERLVDPVALREAGAALRRAAHEIPDLSAPVPVSGSGEVDQAIDDQLAALRDHLRDARDAVGLLAEAVTATAQTFVATDQALAAR